ncbi:MAG: hypothetical protein R3336_09950, partial [Phycisphaeraceae bacterium]|nr:hypothetical protein [Phycisphaeraceae bacterium]
MTAPDPQDDRRQIQTMADRLQFAHVGIAPARPSEFTDYIRNWLDQGHHGEMAWLAEHVEKRVDPTELMPGARSIIVVADRYPAPDT